ncbi:hypothetical protein [Gracilibacillus salinarum]|uniref:Uncharacterized protein n=1 Tax=Gracilibacillus salinarum TaxID=2932255 RepID=A0ABY4GJK6_9BACI|nr:hypothetical protein [Gracilibacillus salinarum]UOQ84520.1 hypothetical protein MUN87_17825 [Gracilibacillus salinarum]
MYQSNQSMDSQQQMKSMCQQYMNFYVTGQLQDGSSFEGIIDQIDDVAVTMLIPEEVELEETDRQFGGYYGGPGRRRYRRYRRQRFPFGLLSGLLLYPFIYPPYPYYYPYY